MTHLCAVRDCGIEIDSFSLMCSHHWALVPSDVARRVNETWRNYRTYRRPGDSQAYTKARREAIQAVAKAVKAP